MFDEDNYLKTIKYYIYLYLYINIYIWELDVIIMKWILHACVVCIYVYAQLLYLLK